MIVVVGRPVPHATPAGVLAGGPAAAAALAAASAGSTVQLVARVADDADGDAMLLHLAGAGVSHVATLRQAAAAGAPVLEAADLELALRYLSDVGVLVLASPDPGLTSVAVDAAAWNHAMLVVLLPHGADVPEGLPADATVPGRGVRLARGRVRGRAGPRSGRRDRVPDDHRGRGRLVSGRRLTGRRRPARAARPSAPAASR